MLDSSKTSLTDAAKAAMESAAGYDEAATRLLIMARNDPDLYSALIGPHERTIALSAIRAMAKTERRAVWSRPTEPDKRVKALARGIYGSLLEFRLPGGLPLRDATKRDLEAAAHFYEIHSSDMAHKARWLKAVHAALPARKTVGKALTDAELAKLQEETQ